MKILKILLKKTSLKKKTFFLIISFFIFLFFINQSIGNYESSLKFLKESLPWELKKQIRKKIFVYKDRDLIEENFFDREKKLRNIPYLLGYIPFEKDKKNSNIKINNLDFVLEKYRTKILTFTKAPASLGSSYLEYYNEKIFLVTAQGVISWINFQDLNKDKFKSRTIKSNITDIIKFNDFYSDPRLGLGSDYGSRMGIKDILVKNKIIYVSFVNQKKKECFNLSILKAELNTEYLKFEKFFDPEQCVTRGVLSEFNSHQTGGRMVSYLENHILFSIGEFRSRKLAQNKESIFGKIISINLSTKKFKIISLGHRNVQGLFYDDKLNTIFMSEQGPQGGDEINININPEKKIKNYGWPIASYGEHYGGKSLKNTIKYFKAPLKKNHLKFQFEEPLIFFKKSIATSELIQVPNSFIKDKNYQLLLASMGYTLSEGDLSLHYFTLNKDLKIVDHNIIPIKERIRDMIFIQKYNCILLFLENYPAIALLKKNN